MFLPGLAKQRGRLRFLDPCHLEAIVACLDMSQERFHGEFLLNTACFEDTWRVNLWLFLLPVASDGEHAKSDYCLIIAGGGIIIKLSEAILQLTAEIVVELGKHNRVHDRAAW